MNANFEGYAERECGEHHTVGTRAWCFDCSEWCYPGAPCVRCERPALLAKARRLVRAAKTWNRTMATASTPGARQEAVEELAHAADDLDSMLSELIDTELKEDP